MKESDEVNVFYSRMSNGWIPRSEIELLERFLDDWGKDWDIACSYAHIKIDKLVRD
jgi:hypothetical protein